MSNKIFIFAFVFLLLFSFVSAVELKLVKVSELKTGDVIVDKNGNEIVVQKIEAQTEKGISNLIEEKVYGSENLKASYVGSGSSGVGTLTGNTIVQGVSEKSSLNFFERLINKIKVWWGK
jgi:hypothetical protein